MKKLTLFCMMALVLTVISCKKEKETEKGFRATTESHAVVGSGKTHLEGLNVEWTTDDIILVFSGTCSDGMRFQTNDNGTTAEFNAVGTLPDNFYTAPYQAFYPTDAFRVRDNDILLSLQKVQPYEANGFANNSNPMVAVSNDTYLPFRNVCGILRLNLYSETRPEIQEILITSNDDNENLWGNGRVTISNGIPSLGSLSSGRNSVALTCDGVRLGRDISNATEFNIILPPGTLSRGFNVKVTDMDGNVYERTAYGDQNTIARNEIKIMPALEVNTETPEPPAADLPKVKTAGIDNITTNSATGGGNVTADGGSSVTARGICWSTSQNPTISNSHTTDGTGLGDFNSSLTGLTANTTYYVRAYATNSAGTAYGDEVMFTTLPIINLPTVTTNNITNITQTTATGGGNVTADGGSNVTARGICWSTSQNPTISNSHTSNGTGLGSFNSSLTGLTANTTYYVRAYATNSAGTAYGNQVTFTTLQNVNLPTVTTNSITNITQTTATGGGNVTADGGSSVTARGICWSTSQNPTISNSHTSNGTGLGSFNSSLTGLTANTTYYVRAYATNSAGTAYGNQVTFTTQSGGGNAPEGAINGLYTINSKGDKVYFSKGNLYYNGTTNKWYFENNQYDYRLYGASGITDYACINGTLQVTPQNQYGVFNMSTTETNFGIYETNDIEDFHNPYVEWGDNPIVNGGNVTGQWKTLSLNKIGEIFDGEWKYVLFERTTNYGTNRRFAEVKVNNVQGMLLFPDEFSWPLSSSLEPTVFNTYNSSWNNVNYTVVQFQVLENAGCVFLPAGGYYDVRQAHLSGDNGYTGAVIGAYWALGKEPSILQTDPFCVYMFNCIEFFNAGTASQQQHATDRLMVRLVYPVSNH